jgi:hypothetical protein
MSVSSPHEITQLLVAWNKGDVKALERLTPLVHTELQRLAKRYMVHSINVMSLASSKGTIRYCPHCTNRVGAAYVALAIMRVMTNSAEPANTIYLGLWEIIDYVTKVHFLKFDLVKPICHFRTGRRPKTL